MRASAGRGRANVRGLTLIELTIAMSVFLVVGYVLAEAVGMGRGVHDTIDGVADTNGELREAARAIGADLAAARSATMTVTVLPDGNDELTLQQPIVLGGVDDWGVYEPLLGSGEAAQNRAGWSVRYTVRNVGAGAGLRRELVRRLLDDTQTVQREEILVEELRSGDVDPPGFTVGPVGDVWEVGLSQVGPSPNRVGRQAVIHARTRN